MHFCQATFYKDEHCIFFAKQLGKLCSSDNIIQKSLLNSPGTGSELEEDGMLEPVLEQGLEYQISVVENTDTTDAKGREGGVLIATS